jgi:hypothetical protein
VGDNLRHPAVELDSPAEVDNPLAAESAGRLAEMDSPQVAEAAGRLAEMDSPQVAEADSRRSPAAGSRPEDPIGPGSPSWPALLLVVEPVTWVS